MSSSEAWPFPLDTSRNVIVSAFGRKGSGKTTFNRAIYRAWPTAKLCVDVNGEADPGPDAQLIRRPLPRMPERVKDKPAPNLHLIADPGSPSYREDLDDAVGMAMQPADEDSLVWVGEVGEFTTGNKTGPNLRRLLQQSRHYRTSALFDGPRPMDIDKLVIAQADLVAIFDMPDPHDQERVAQVIGWPPNRFREQCRAAWDRGPFWHLLYVAKHKTLFECPPVPES